LLQHIKIKWLLSASLVLSGAVVAKGDDWPQWRGPQGDGISREKGLAVKWPDDGPPKVWSKEVGRGHSSPVVVEGKLYLFSRDEQKNQEVLAAYDANTGNALWEQRYVGGYNKQTDATWHGTRATPVVEAGKIYTYGGTGDLVCRDAANGQELWHTNVLKETKAKELEWGEASSPLIVGDTIYIQGGIGEGVPVAIAVNKSSGKITWQSDAKGSATGKNSMPNGTGGGYAAPILASVGGAKQLIVLGGTAVYGMDPATGKAIWQEEWITSYDVNATTPIYQEPNLFISTGYGKGCMMLEVSATGAKKLWESKALVSKFPQVILDRGYLYGVSDEAGGILKCVKWPENKVAWEVKGAGDRMGSGGSIVRFGDDYLITLSERGRLTLAKATGQGYAKISQVKEITHGTNVWATPTIANGKLYIKGVEELICLDISGK
jgi:outer membrane protein assembly factor BamB